MVKLVQQKGICETSRLYNATSKRVRKRANPYGKKGLRDLQIEREPQNIIPHKTPKEIEDRVIELGKTHRPWGRERLKMHYQLPISTKAIAPILRQAGLATKKKRWEKQKHLGEQEKTLNPL